MDSPNSSYVSSPELAPKRSSKRSESPNAGSFDLPTVDKERHTHLRFLVSNLAAGSVIGKGGSSISELQSKSRARIQLSRNNEFFPGTSDRIVMVSGACDDILKATKLILAKLADEEGIYENDDVEYSLKLRLVVPNTACGAIIGKAGSVVKSLQEDSHATIKISPQESGFGGLNDRIVTIAGSLEEQRRALCMILSKLIRDAHYSTSITGPYLYGGGPGLNVSSVPNIPVGYVLPYGPMYGFGRNDMGSKLPNRKGRMPHGGPNQIVETSNERESSVTIGVADEHIGAVVGRGGRIINELIQASGARIKISDKGDYFSGTSDRKVTITGSPASIRIAEGMINKRVAENAERS